MELINLLIKNNFSEKEAKVYLACLELKIANASTISRYTKEKRSTVYSILKELQKKGIINEIDKNKIASYSAVPPEHIAKKLEENFKKFQSLLPAFNAFTEKFGIAPKVQFFEGLEGIKNIYNDILQSQVEVCALLGTSKFPKFISNYLETIFFPEKIKRNIFSRTLLSDNSVNKKNINKIQSKKYKREWKITNGLTFMENIIINIYGPNKIMIAVFTEKEPFGLVISSYYLYETILSIFNFLRKK
ncbi:hypothetical protein K9M48_02660 [Candidatus Gracilibacteria bacterium]|nr:hypothetical protein [Candidatus Gracilibacteria bacterium]